MSLFASFDKPLGEIYSGDCRAVIQENLMQWQGAFDFVFADPPFNIGHGYDIYYDDLQDNDFAKFMVEWISLCSICVKPAGVFAIHVPDNLVHLVLTTANAHSMTRIAWVIWHYRFGQWTNVNWINSKCHCLIFRNDNYIQEDVINYPNTFNSDAVLTPSDRATKYNDSRTEFTENPGMRVPLDVWSIENDGRGWGRVVGNANERVQGHPNQLPSKYLERLIAAYTSPGEVVLDPFGGTGTTFDVARRMNRSAVTIEISKDYCLDIISRATIDKEALLLHYLKLE